MSPIVTIQGKKIKLTNLDKILYPESGFTKSEVIDYYRKAAHYILPHLHDRPVTMKRFPEGVMKEFFYQKHCPSFKPEWVKTSDERSGIAKNFCLINDLASLIWVENLASIELHTLLAKVEDLTRPTAVVFDLDPGEPAALADCLEAALILREMLNGVGLKCFAKTSGDQGLHLYVPLNTPVTYEQTKYFAKTAAQILEKHYPQKIISKMHKELRNGKVFIDWSQNSSHKTTVCVYSLRATAAPMVSMPVTWTQIEQAVGRNAPGNLICTAKEAIQKLEKNGDIFNEVLILKQRLPLKFQKDPLDMPEKPGKTRILETYREKRDFSKTTEPQQDDENSSSQDRYFVIHKHAARRLHYDFRIESEGVLISWAVPKGPSSDPLERRLAVRTEDHPLEYKDFEGVIPRGQYGAGKVLIWDTGTYRNITRNSKREIIPVSEAVKTGKVEIIFEGNKIKGGYVFLRLKTQNNDDKQNWLLVKVKDKYVGTLSESDL
jgi:bifunctional non-homologous end joining protein LigD